MVPATSSAVRVTWRSSSSSSMSSINRAASAARTANASAVSRQMVVATSPMRSTRPRLRADISAPRPRAARRAMCSARSPLRSISGSMRRMATYSRRSSDVVSPWTSWCCTVVEICPINLSMTSSRFTSCLAASRSPASSACVAPAIPSPTKAKACANRRSTSWGSGIVRGHSGCSVTSGPICMCGRSSDSTSSGNVFVLPPSLNGIPNTIPAPFRRDDRRRRALQAPTGQRARVVPVVDTPRRYIGRMVLGVVIGLAAGLVMGLAWHMARLASAAGSARLAEGRLADAQAQSATLAAQLKTASEAAAAAETARAVAVSELDLLRTSEIEASRRAAQERDLLAGAFSELSAQALAKNNEQFLTLADSKLNEVRTATQGDLSQRQQAIAQLLDPLSETLARYERGLRDMEVERKGAYATLNERVAALHLGHEQLQRETRNLVTALRSPQTR